MVGWFFIAFVTATFGFFMGSLLAAAKRSDQVLYCIVVVDAARHLASKYTPRVDRTSQSVAVDQEDLHRLQLALDSLDVTLHPEDPDYSSRMAPSPSHQQGRHV